MPSSRMLTSFAWTEEYGRAVSRLYFRPVYNIGHVLDIFREGRMVVHSRPRAKSISHVGPEEWKMLPLLMSDIC